jgi:hypothetical protein
MSRVYKLTDENMCTYNNTQWEIGVAKSTSGKGLLCGPGWLHCYSNKYLAILLNPIHARFERPRLFLAEATGNHSYENGLKEGSTTMKLIKEVDVPQITTTQRVAFGILCALEVEQTHKFNQWAKNWLNNIDRTYTAAAAAHADAAATYAHADAAYAAAHAAAAADAATAADYAAAHAAAVYAKLNLKKIAEKALQY